MVTGLLKKNIYYFNKQKHLLACYLSKLFHGMQKEFIVAPITRHINEIVIWYILIRLSRLKKVLCCTHKTGISLVFHCQWHLSNVGRVREVTEHAAPALGKTLYCSLKAWIQASPTLICCQSRVKFHIICYLPNY